jgi:hypothetical protein
MGLLIQPYTYQALDPVLMQQTEDIDLSAEFFGVEPPQGVELWGLPLEEGGHPFSSGSWHASYHSRSLEALLQRVLSVSLRDLFQWQEGQEWYHINTRKSVETIESWRSQLTEYVVSGGYDVRKFSQFDAGITSEQGALAHFLAHRNSEAQHTSLMSTLGTMQVKAILTGEEDGKPCVYLVHQDPSQWSWYCEALDWMKYTLLAMRKANQDRGTQFAWRLRDL